MQQGAVLDCSAICHALYMLSLLKPHLSVNDFPFLIVCLWLYRYGNQLPCLSFDRDTCLYDKHPAIRIPLYRSIFSEISFHLNSSAQSPFIYIFKFIALDVYK